ncbi:hypothetical protein BJ138DRAFT_1001185 [Hygrophoropsis aurantiaca]|uniref:Uncharacterized protein n=1 Tax=Hygrophoropsis aurantiaca TaxID=72124 RepID=A0ACB8AK78_9AGAM|nr:hypothetical protein BJ138DRAFT_1001185 [Hygrophoropsis aurantiaca]
MALTVSPQSALSSWDETIVPALRKRLEGESRILAKRMSVASISSLDDPLRPSAHANSGITTRDQASGSKDSREGRTTISTPKPISEYTKAPLNGQHDGSLDHHRANGTIPNGVPSYTRVRTYSQPYTYESTPNGHVNDVAHTTELRPASRSSDVRPTRIPVVARGRAGSTSSHVQSTLARSDSRNGYNPYYHSPSDISPDLWAVHEADNRNPSSSTVSVAKHPRSDIMNEPAPFGNAGSTISSKQSDYTARDDTYFTRPSNDSEERPFEHWYRGDVHRNGGVGELRVAKHQEMLQIANYGHNIRKSPNRSATRELPVRVESHRRRKRADSVAGIGARESLYLDDERTNGVDMMFDESPLTDIDGEGESDPENIYDAYVTGTEDVHPHPTFAASSPGLSVTNADSQSVTPTTFQPSSHHVPPPTRIPRISSDSPRVSNPSDPLRNNVESPLPSTSSTTSGPRSRTMSRSTSQSQQQTPELSQSQKRRAKSPATTSPLSTPKKAKTKARSPPSKRKEDVRGSVASYPTPEGDGMADAIPTWIQPVPKSGNWDEVVLPVVARKKGLDGQYEQADGSPRAKEPDRSPPEPAPGTFGFDYSKYRRAMAERLPMDEFGHREPENALQDDSTTVPFSEPVLELEKSRQDPPRAFAKPPQSPAPFSQYIYPRESQIPTVTVTRASFDVEQGKDDDDTGGGGCCKCVIM